MKTLFDVIVSAINAAQPFAVGIISSEKGSSRQIQFAQDKMVTEKQLNGAGCPVGLEIHAVSVTAIAVSIAVRRVQHRAKLLRAK